MKLLYRFYWYGWLIISFLEVINSDRRTWLGRILAREHHHCDRPHDIQLKFNSPQVVGIERNSIVNDWGGEPTEEHHQRLQSEVRTQHQEQDLFHYLQYGKLTNSCLWSLLLLLTSLRHGLQFVMRVQSGELINEGVLGGHLTNVRATVGSSKLWRGTNRWPQCFD